MSKIFEDRFQYVHLGLILTFWMLYIHHNVYRFVVHSALIISTCIHPIFNICHLTCHVCVHFSIPGFVFILGENEEFLDSRTFTFELNIFGMFEG